MKESLLSSSWIDKTFFVN